MPKHNKKTKSHYPVWDEGIAALSQSLSGLLDASEDLEVSIFKQQLRISRLDDLISSAEQKLQSLHERIAFSEAKLNNLQAKF